MAPVLGWIFIACGEAKPLGSLEVDSRGGSSGSTSGAGGSGSIDTGGTGGAQATAGTGGSSAGGAGGSTAGAAGEGGSSGSGGSSPVELGYEPVGVGDPWFFDAEDELEQFKFNFGAGTNGGATWDAAGEVHLSASFTGAAQQVLMHVSMPWDDVAQMNTPVDMTRRVLRARVRVASGGAMSAGVMAYSQSDGWTWSASAWTSVSTLSEPKDVEFDLDESADPGSVVRLGLQLYANQSGNIELIIDDIRLEPKDAVPDSDAGAPDAGGIEDVDAGDSDGGEAPDAGAEG